MNNKRPGKGKPFSRGKNSRLPIAVNVTRNLSNDWFMGCASSNDAKRCHQWISKEESGPIWLLRESLFSLGPLHMSPFHRGFICEISAWFPRWEGRRRVVVRNSGNKANMVKHKVITFAPVTALETLKAVSLLSNGMLMMKKIQRQSKTMQNSFEELIPVKGWTVEMAAFPARLPRSLLEKPRSRQPSQPALSYEHIQDFTKDLEVRWDLGNRASICEEALRTFSKRKERRFYVDELLTQGKLHRDHFRKMLRLFVKTKNSKKPT